MSANVTLDLFDIAREAIRNAFAHANASFINVLIAYEKHTLIVTVKDNGCGIDSKVLREGEREGHWGLRGMQERANHMGARLQITRPPEGGTLLMLSLTARLAYDAK